LRYEFCNSAITQTELSGGLHGMRVRGFNTQDRWAYLLQLKSPLKECVDHTALLQKVYTDSSVSKNIIYKVAGPHRTIC
jgi:threonyl-tRNA synthetase